MGFGLSKKTGWFYNDFSIVGFLLTGLLFLSVDTISRYLLVLDSGELKESVVYSILRVFIFGFLTLSFLTDRKTINIFSLKWLYLFILACSISLFINFLDFNDFFKSVIYTFSFVLIYRYGIVLGNVKEDFKVFNRAITIIIIILLIQYIGTYYLKFGSISVVSNDAIFSIVVFIPFLFLFEKKRLRLLLTVVIMICTVMSQKRSAILVVNFSILLALILYYSERSKARLIFIGLFLALLAFNFLNEIENIGFVDSVLHRFENSSDNGRNEINEELLGKISKRDGIETFFGLGYAATIRDIGIPSHNDFLEILYDYGIIALIIYIVSLMYLGLKAIFWYKRREEYLEYYICYLVAFIMLIGLSTVNYMIYSVYNMVLFLAIGISYSKILLRIKHSK
ncbi:hypothetical protein AAW12_11580 [Sphingobacterium sp. Ag1]|uniref:O-antigen ligase family protein n=1 Tax=Sphingobacterium sp. Ag1 TaxID=1643451 RepID=UPI000628085E|nr:O-antigen ligase family protein [Sphingobacterium sp. Ag1]KKO91164.1 hypothetical protein AAW12_11580 [Sphingobacterium sp. Ag1]